MIALNGMKLGVATAATQIEGGDENNSWADWARRGGIKDGSSPVRACGHWERVEEDASLMAELGIREYRLGLEWSRIEPKRGIFDPEAMEHYRREIISLLDRGITPLVTLHHFTNPLWFENAGAFESEGCVVPFREYVNYVLNSIGDLVSDYITINEPNVYAANGYLFGEWPPGKKDARLALRVMKNMALCHYAAYDEIHTVRQELGAAGKTRVGVAQHMRVFDPLRRFNPVDRIAARIYERVFQTALTDSMSFGRLRLPLGLGVPVKRKRYYEFIGINYYSRFAVKGTKLVNFPGRPENDLGWEIYPEGLTRLIRKCARRYKAPVFITENGTCDRADAFRARYIRDHLAAAAASGANVEKYFYWTFTDNFEWAEGETAPFGLVRCEFKTGERTVRASGRFYAGIIRENAVTDALQKEFVGDVK